MRVRNIFAVVVLTFLLLNTQACTALNLNKTPTVFGIRMTNDGTGDTTVTSYSPNQQFFVFMDLSGIKVGSVIESRWYVVNVTGVDPNTQIATLNTNYQAGTAKAYFKLTATGGGVWPTGTYKVEIYLDDAIVGSQTFSVQ